MQKGKYDFAKSIRDDANPPSGLQYAYNNVHAKIHTSSLFEENRYDRKKRTRKVSDQETSPEVGIYKRKQDSKKTRKQNLDQKSDQEKSFFFFLVAFLVEFLFS